MGSNRISVVHAFSLKRLDTALSATRALGKHRHKGHHMYPKMQSLGAHPLRCAQMHSVRGTMCCSHSSDRQPPRQHAAPEAGDKTAEEPGVTVANLPRTGYFSLAGRCWAGAVQGLATCRAGLLHACHAGSSNLILPFIACPHCVLRPTLLPALITAYSTCADKVN